MCRYATAGPYRDRYACFDCRVSLRWPHDPDVEPAALRPPVCPTCRAPLTPVGLDFKAPPRRHEDRWKRLRTLCRNGFRFTSCGCSGKGLTPSELTLVELFVRGSATRSDEEELMRRIAARVRAHAERSSIAK